MVRTQISLPEEQYEKLKKRAAGKGVSMSELVREGIDLVLSAPDGLSRDEMKKRALEMIGKYNSGLTDVSEKHDEYLAEAYHK